MNNQQLPADSEVYQASDTSQDVRAGLECHKWYFLDEEYGYIGPYDSEQGAKEAWVSYQKYVK